MEGSLSRRWRRTLNVQHSCDAVRFFLIAHLRVKPSDAVRFPVGKEPATSDTRSSSYRAEADSRTRWQPCSKEEPVCLLKSNTLDGEMTASQVARVSPVWKNTGGTAAVRGPETGSRNYILPCRLMLTNQARCPSQVPSNYTKLSNHDESSNRV